MDEFVIRNARLVRPEHGIETGYVHVNGGAIVAVGAGAPPDSIDCLRIDGHGQLLTPGLIDMHTHGIRDHVYEDGPDELFAAAKVLGAYGVTTVVPTIVPSIKEKGLEPLARLAGALEDVQEVSIPGLHVEGPFVAITGAACDTRDGDVGLLDEIIDSCAGRIAVMSIAPEVPNVFPVIERLIDAGITPFITHTRASVEETVAAIDAGARHATHFYDVFPVPEETDPGVRPVGVVETIFADPRATCDFICDGIHVHPMAVRAAVAAKGWEGVSLITDASFGAGLGPGRYETPWGYAVDVQPGGAPRIADPEHPMHGGLAGSALTMDRGVNNLLQWLVGPPEHVWAMATANPARVLGANRKGRLAPDMDADLVLWNDAGGESTVSRTWAKGRLVYDATPAEVS